MTTESSTNDQAAASTAPAAAVTPTAPAAPVAQATTTPAATPSSQQRQAEKPKAAVASPTPTVTSTAQPKNNAAENTQESWEGIVAKVLAGNSSEQKSVVHALTEYMAEMKPGKVVSVADVDKNQRKLYRLFQFVISSSEDFNACFQLLMKAWFYNSGEKAVFHETFWSRGMEHVNLKNNERTSFRAICNILSILSDVKGRASILRQLNVEKSFASGFDEAGKTKVVTFLNKFKN